MSLPADESKSQPEVAGEMASAYFTGDELVRLLSSALEHSTSLVLIADLDGRIAFVNPKFTQTTGYTAEEVIGGEVLSLGGEIAEGQEAVWDAVQARGFWNGEVKNRSKTGEEYWLEVHITPIRDREGVVTHYLGVAEDVTERKVAEQSLTQIASILEATTDFVGFAHADGRVRYANRAARRAAGIADDADVTGMNISDFHSSWTNDLLASEAFPTAERQGVWRGEGAWVDRQGNETLTSMVILAHRGAGGEIEFYSTISRDIREQKAADQALRESEERYRVLYEDNPSMYFTVDKAGTVRSVNRYGASQLGYTPEELVGRSVLDVFHPDDSEAVKGQLAETVANSGRAAQWEFRKVRKDGTVLWVREAAQAIRDPDGETIVLIVCEDITERKQAEEALRGSEQRYRALLEATPDMMFRLSREGEYLDFIPAKGLEPFVPPKEFLGKDLSEVLPADTVRELQDAMHRALETGELQTLEYELPGSEARHYEGRIVVSGEDEVLAIVRDITESRNAEEALQQLREELEESVERRLEEKNPYSLTFRELTVLQLVASGRPDKEIGNILGIAPRTANKHVENILSKMGAASRTEAGVRAVREGLVD